MLADCVDGLLLHLCQQYCEQVVRNVTFLSHRASLVSREVPLLQDRWASALMPIGLCLSETQLIVHWPSAAGRDEVLSH